VFCNSIGIFVVLLVGLRVAVILGGRKVRPVDPAGLIRRPEEEAWAERLPNGDLRLRWRSHATIISIYQGDSLQNILRNVPLAQVNGHNEMTVTGLDPAVRYYFELVFSGGSGAGKRLIVAERYVPLQGVFNFRDLGGYETLSGGRVRWGRVYRSDELSELSDADLAYLERLGLASIYDLRSNMERASRIDRLPVTVEDRYQTLPVYADEPVSEVLPALLFQRHRLGDTLGNGYPRMLETGAPVYGALLRKLADPAQLPAVFHCTAGKDRAGIASALLLSLLGVPDETIVADYSLSNLGFDHYYQEFVQAGLLSRLGVPYEQVQALFIVNPAWMESLLAYVETTYGTTENFLMQKAGLDAETIEQIRAELIE
jgi:protein-tyrosine phosphatase